MGVKKRFIEMVKSGYPEFDPQNDSVEIEFDGGGDSFGSFSYLGIWPKRDKVEGFNLDEHWSILFEVLDSASVEYIGTLERNRIEERKNKSFWWRLWN